MARAAKALPPSPEALCADLARTMDALLQVIEEEAGHVRSGKLFAAAQLKAKEAALVRHYSSAMAAIEGRMEELERLVPRQLDEVQRQHGAFRSLLRINLAALATARELSELRLQDLADRVGSRKPPVEEPVPLKKSA